MPLRTYGTFVRCSTGDGLAQPPLAVQDLLESYISLGAEEDLVEAQPSVVRLFGLRVLSGQVFILELCAARHDFGEASSQTSD